MMFSDVAIYFNSLPAETKILVMQMLVLTIDVLYFFWLRNFFNEEERKLKMRYKFQI